MLPYFLEICQISIYINISKSLEKIDQTKVNFYSFRGCPVYILFIVKIELGLTHVNVMDWLL